MEATDPVPSRLVVLASGGGSNLQAVLDAIEARALHARVVAVISDRRDAGALARAEAAGVHAHTVSPLPHESRADFDARLADAVAAHQPDLIVLAGWMRLLSMAFLSRFPSPGHPSSVINLHPALPGELPGVRAIERAFAEFAAGDRRHTGVMVHVVPDEGIDTGPVLAATEVPIFDDDDLASLSARVHATEHRLLVGAIAAWIRHPSPTVPFRPTATSHQEVSS